MKGAVVIARAGDTLYTEAMIIESVSHRGLRRFIEQNNPRFLRRDLAGRVEDVLLTLLDAEDISHFIARAPGG